jgi:hypothetical protein
MSSLREHHRIGAAAESSMLHVRTAALLYPASSIKHPSSSGNAISYTLKIVAGAKYSSFATPIGMTVFVRFAVTPLIS